MVDLFTEAGTHVSGPIRKSLLYGCEADEILRYESEALDKSSKYSSSETTNWLKSQHLQLGSTRYSDSLTLT